MGGCRGGDCRAAVRLGAVLVLSWLTVSALVTGCSPTRDNGVPLTGGEALGGNLHVLVAASLLPVAETLASEFERRHPGVDVLISAAGSSALREQVLAGAPADVFVPADPVHLETIRDEMGLVGTPVAVARNSLVLAVPTGNDARVASLADLSRPELLIGLCAADVPCGAHARAGLSRAGIAAASDTDEPNARALVTKLAAGELDAAVVYASDADSVEDIKSLGWPAGAAPETIYQAAVLADALNPGAATAFVEFLLSAPARDAFEDHKFRAP